MVTAYSSFSENNDYYHQIACHFVLVQVLAQPLWHYPNRATMLACECEILITPKLLACSQKYNYPATGAPVRLSNNQYSKTFSLLINSEYFYSDIAQTLELSCCLGDHLIISSLRPLARQDHKFFLAHLFLPPSNSL